VRETIAQPDWSGQAGAATRYRSCARAGTAALDPKVSTLVLYGDVPLTRAETLEALCQTAGKGVACSRSNWDDPRGYGASSAVAVRSNALSRKKMRPRPERALREINTGIMVLRPRG